MIMVLNYQVFQNGLKRAEQSAEFRRLNCPILASRNLKVTHLLGSNQPVKVYVSGTTGDEFEVNIFTSELRVRFEPSDPKSHSRCRRKGIDIHRQYVRFTRKDEPKFTIIPITSSRSTVDNIGQRVGQPRFRVRKDSTTR